MKKCLLLMLMCLLLVSSAVADQLFWGNSSWARVSYASGETNWIAGNYDDVTVGCFVQLIDSGDDETNNPAYGTGTGVSGDDVVVKCGWMGEVTGEDGYMDGEYADGTNGHVFFVRVWTAPALDYSNGLVPTALTNYYGDSELWLFNYDPIFPGSFQFGGSNGFSTTLSPMSPPNATGSVHVTILPSEVVATGAQWRIDSGAWYDNGMVVSVATGEYTLSYKEISGWQSPAAQSITVTADVTNAFSGTYTEIPATNMGYLLGFLEPQAVTNNGARWRITDGDWQEDNTLLELVSGIYTIEFNTVTGYYSPTSDVVITVETGITNAFTAYYDPMTNGWLQVDISPQAAVDAGAQWRVLDGDWQNSGVALEIDAGLYTIEYSDVTGWSKPATNETATISVGVTTTVSCVYEEVITDGALLITIEPEEAVTAGALWRMNGQVWHESGVEVPFVAGDYYIEFLGLTGWTAPTQQQITVTAGETNAASFTYQSQGSVAGNLTIYIDPQGAVDDAARWRVNGGTWQESGATLSGLIPGLYNVSFMDLTYWTEPAVQTLMVYDAQTTISTGLYAQTYGAVKAIISPATAISDGAQWRLTSGSQTNWQDSDATLSNVAVGSYSVEFLSLDGWVRPDSKAITVRNGQTTSTYGYYTRDSGNLCCLLEPEGVVLAGGQWGLIDGSTTNWYNSGVTLQSLGVGEYTLTFRPVDGWTTPDNQVVIIGDSQTETVTGTYGDPAMLLWLKMDGTNSGTAYDSSGYGHNGAIKFGVTVGEPGVIGDAYHFEGTGGYVRVPPFDVDGLSNFTVTFWVKRDTLRADEAVFSMGGTSQSGSINIATAMDPLGFGGLDMNARMMYESDNSTLRADNLTATNAWYFYSLVIGEHAQQLYVNGTETDSSAYDIGHFSPTSYLYIGYNQADGGNYFGGYLDDLRLYGRALGKTELDEIQALPEQGRVSCVITPEEAAADGAQWMLSGAGSPDTGWQNSGVVIGGVPTGTYEVIFNSLSSWTSPGSQTITVSADERVDVTGVYTQLFGSVTCTIEPTNVVALGAQWRLTNGSDTVWHDSGYLMTNVPAASYTIEFSEIEGWTAPGTISITVPGQGTVSEQGTYTQITPEQGVLTCVITPQGAIDVGAEWRVIGDEWLSSGTLISIDPGDYTVEFKEVPGWVRPDDYTAEIVAGVTNTATVEYQSVAPVEDGILVAYILPDKAVAAGAKWRISGGDWQDNMASMQLPAGAYIVEYKDVEGWEKPVDGYMLIENGVTRMARGAYSHGIVAYDFDGDRIADPAVFVKTNSVWQIIRSGDNQIEEYIWGWYETIPVPADYDGDEIMDVAVYYPEGGDWYIYGSHWGDYIHHAMGSSNAAPVPGYYDYDMSDPVWDDNLFIKRLSHGRRAHQKYNGPYWTAFPNGQADACAFLWEAATWNVELSRNSEHRSKQLDGVYYSVPVPGDYDGDRFTDLATYGPDLGTWSIRMSSDAGFHLLQCGGGDTAIPTPGDFDGDGITDPAVYDVDAMSWIILQSTQGTLTTNDWGKTNGLPVVADYDGDGLDDLSLYNRTAGAWYILQSSDGEEREEELGGPYAIPVTLQYLLNEWYDIVP